MDLTRVKSSRQLGLSQQTASAPGTPYCWSRVTVTGPAGHAWAAPPALPVSEFAWPLPNHMPQELQGLPVFISS